MKTVILAAGFGSRLWPLSTSERPKQFQKLLDDKSLLQHTYELLSEFVPAEELYVLTLAGLESLVVEQLPDIDLKNIIAVPERRNTLPHTIYALNQLGLNDDEPVFFSPVDHYIADPGKFIDNLRAALARLPAAGDKTYLLCTKAKVIDRSLGYVQVTSSMAVSRFIEKPDEPTAGELAEADNAYINTMRYVISRSSLANLFESIGNDELALSIKKVLTTSGKELKAAFLAMSTLDISRGLFEPAKGLRAIDIDSEFTDIGRFSTLYEINPKDQNGNVVMGNVILDNISSNNFIVNQTEQPLVIIDMRNLVIVQTPAGSFVSPTNEAEAIGEIYKSKVYTSK